MSMRKSNQFHSCNRRYTILSKLYFTIDSIVLFGEVMGQAEYIPESLRGATIRILGRGLDSFLEINIFVGKMSEINKWPQDMVEINILPTQEVEINII